MDLTAVSIFGFWVPWLPFALLQVWPFCLWVAVALKGVTTDGSPLYPAALLAVYRVRTAPHLSQRIAVDMLRDAQAEGRFQTTQTLHLARAG